LTSLFPYDIPTIKALSTITPLLEKFVLWNCIPPSLLSATLILTKFKFPECSAKTPHSSFLKVVKFEKVAVIGGFDPYGSD
jgi:hypothetical protein